jgi:hypothetical protein
MSTQYMYGLFPGGDPRKFIPDEECCTPEEIAAHAAACKEWDAGRGIDRGPSCATNGDGSAWTGTGFGIGTYEYEYDEPDDEDLIDLEVSA